MNFLQILFNANKKNESRHARKGLIYEDISPKNLLSEIREIYLRHTNLPLPAIRNALPSKGTRYDLMAKADSYDFDVRFGRNNG